MRTDEDTDIISMTKVIREDEHAMDTKLALEKKAKKKKEDYEQTKMDSK